MFKWIPGLSIDNDKKIDNDMEVDEINEINKEDIQAEKNSVG